MNYYKYLKSNISAFLFSLSLVLIFSGCGKEKAVETTSITGDYLSIGWGSADITPGDPVVMSGGRTARLSTGVLDPVTVTALVLESVSDNGETEEIVAQVSVEVSCLREDVMDFIVKKAQERITEIKPHDIIVFATHTHTGPDSRPAPHLAEKLKGLGIDVPEAWTWWGIDLGVRPTPRDYAELVADRVVDAVEQALKNRKPGGVSFGQGYAVAGLNRLTRYQDGRSAMYGATDKPDFSHMEGYEDHSVGFLYTYDLKKNLTGIVINIACPAQVSEGGTLISADYWHETRNELRERLGSSLYVLPQIAAAGDQSPHIKIGEKAIARTQKLMFGDTIKTGDRTIALRKDLAIRITDAATSILPYLENHIDWSPVLIHRLEQVEMERRHVTGEELEKIGNDFNRFLGEYMRMYKELEENPDKKLKKGWQNEITPVYWDLRRTYRVLHPYEHNLKTMSVPVHVVRIGDLAIATNPFELYLDYGMRIKARSKAVQTFPVQLSNGYFGYLPTERSVEGGAYGAIPESNEAGPEGGQQLVEATLKIIDSLWNEK